MGKIIVIHKAPDLDAVTSAWLVKKFLPGWKKARIVFVNAGLTWQGIKVDSEPDVLHLDTGLGLLDHHQSNDDICAALLVWELIQKEKRSKKTKKGEAMQKMLAVVNEVDHGRDISWPEGENDRYLFFLEEIFGGLKGRGKSDEEIVEFGLLALDGVFKVFQDRVTAENLLKSGETIEFATAWGKGLAAETVNDTILTFGEKRGYSLVIKKDAKEGNVRIYGRWDRGVDLTSLFEKLKEKDRQADWFLHQSKKILLNGSASNPGMRATKLSLEEIVEIIESLK